MMVLGGRSNPESAPQFMINQLIKYNQLGEPDVILMKNWSLRITKCFNDIELDLGLSYQVHVGSFRRFVVKNGVMYL